MLLLREEHPEGLGMSSQSEAGPSSLHTGQTTPEIDPQINKKQDSSDLLLLRCEDERIPWCSLQVSLAASG